MDGTLDISRLEAVSETVNSQREKLGVSFVLSKSLNGGLYSLVVDSTWN
jgi:hypothetical protein